MAKEHTLNCKINFVFLRPATIIYSNEDIEKAFKEGKIFVKNIELKDDGYIVLDVEVKKC